MIRARGDVIDSPVGKRYTFYVVGLAGDYLTVLVGVAFLVAVWVLR